jgi:hypothetical protein
MYGQYSTKIHHNVGESKPGVGAEIPKTHGITTLSAIGMSLLHILRHNLTKKCCSQERSEL